MIVFGQIISTLVAYFLFVCEIIFFGKLIWNLIQLKLVLICAHNVSPRYIAFRCCGVGELKRRSVVAPVGWPMDNVSFERSLGTCQLRAGRSGDRIPLGGETFRTRPDRPWGPPSLLYSAYRVSIPGVKRPGRGVDHSPRSCAEVKERVGLYLYSPSGTSC
jgi:hypothetical protein